MPRLADVAGLECHLQTAAAHAESHRIHVDVIRQRRSCILDAFDWLKCWKLLDKWTWRVDVTENCAGSKEHDTGIKR